MIKTLTNMMKQDKEKVEVPRSAGYDPVKTIWRERGFCPENKYSKMFRFEDIKLRGGSKDDKEAMFLEYSSSNSFDSGATTKITINNEGSIAMILRNRSLST